MKTALKKRLLCTVTVLTCATLLFGCGAEKSSGQKTGANPDGSGGGGVEQQ